MINVPFVIKDFCFGAVFWGNEADTAVPGHVKSQQKNCNTLKQNIVCRLIDGLCSLKKNVVDRLKERHFCFFKMVASL